MKTGWEWLSVVLKWLSIYHLNSTSLWVICIIIIIIIIINIIVINIIIIIIINIVTIVIIIVTVINIVIIIILFNYFVFLSSEVYVAGSSTDEEAGMIKPFALRSFLFAFNIVGWLFCMLFFLLLLLLLFSLSFLFLIYYFLTLFQLVYRTWNFVLVCFVETLVGSLGCVYLILLLK